MTMRASSVEASTQDSTDVRTNRADELWHGLDVSHILISFDTSIDSGLSSQAVQNRLHDYGHNLVSEPPSRSPWEMWVDQFKSLPVALLTIAAIIAVMTGGIADAAVIMGVVLINAVIGYVTERQSDRIIRSLEHWISPSAQVIRNHQSVEVPVQDIVPGDILVLRPGTHIAGDARVVEATALHVDESVLTGESVPVAKITTSLSNTEIPLGDRQNMVYRGTWVMGGQGLAVVVATAQHTEMGKIQALVGSVESPKTPIEIQLDRVGSQLVVLSSAICVVVFVIGWLRGYEWLTMLKTSIALAVAAVPEGLPAVATATLALGIWTMRKHHVLIRRLEAVETLGAVQALCLDKTGTLTTNKMSVVELYADHTSLRIEEGRWLRGQELVEPLDLPPILKLLQVIALCNESELLQIGNAIEWCGSSTENALLELATQAGIDVLQLRADCPRLRTLHRSQVCNVMSTLHCDCAHQHWVAMKGNPLEVLAQCGYILEREQVIELSSAKRIMIATANEQMASQALRVLGVAYRLTDRSLSESEQEQYQEALEQKSEHILEPKQEYPLFIWLGLIGIVDPIRQGVKPVIEAFHEAGIETIMVTGDQRSTALAIGRQLNLSGDKVLNAIDAIELAVPAHVNNNSNSNSNNNSNQRLFDHLREPIHIFSRISPTHKLQIVQALQRAGKTVAMTGDGINDTPALKAAAVGIAMGDSGTDVACEVADVVLEDDNLATMMIAIGQGRTIYSNIRKAVHFLLSTNLSEILVMLICTSLAIGQPLNAMQLLWLNLVTDIFPGLALALEPPEPDVLQQSPRDPNEPIIPNADFWRIGWESSMISFSTLVTYGYALWNYGIGLHASTIGFMSLTLAQLLHAISCRSQSRVLLSSHHRPTNLYLVIALIGSIGLQLITFAIPPLQHLLQIVPLNRIDIAVITLSAVLPLMVNEFAKSPKYSWSYFK